MLDASVAVISGTTGARKFTAHTGPRRASEESSARSSGDSLMMLLCSPAAAFKHQLHSRQEPPLEDEDGNPTPSD